MEKLNEIPILACTSLDTAALDTVFDYGNITDQSIPPEEALPQRKKAAVSTISVRENASMRTEKHAGAA